MLLSNIRHWLEAAGLRSGSGKPPETRFSLHSGERQTGKSLDQVRRDHVARYRYAAEQFKVHGDGGRHRFGLDVFCGTGYGTHLLSVETGCPVLGIDASAQAIELANEHFSSDSTFYSAKVFPFRLPSVTYDFIACLESVEHVPQTEMFLSELVGSLKPGGLLVLSTPNASLWSLDLNPNPFHFRHFARAELEDLLARNAACGLRLLDWQGQNIYRFEDGRMYESLPEDQMGLHRRMDGQINVFTFLKPP